MVTLKTSIKIPFILKTKYYGPAGLEGFGTFWDVVPISLLMIEKSTSSSTLSSFTLNASENSFIIKQKPSLILKTLESSFVIRQK